MMDILTNYTEEMKMDERSPKGPMLQHFFALTEAAINCS